MSSNKEIITYIYDATDFNFVVNSSEESESSFDNILQQTWKQAEENNVFRYILNIRNNKILRGKYRFLAQLNPDRIQRRRVPESITSMTQSCSSTSFNFKKLTQQEILFDVGNGDANDIIAINDSPLEQYHCLFLADRLECLPQIMTQNSLRKVIELFLLSNSWSLRAVFNSLGALASVNHLHWHLYYLKYEMLLEYIDLSSYTSDIHLLKDYAAKGFCLKLSDFEDITDFVSRTYLVVVYLQSCQLAHNLYITRAKSKSKDELYDDVRIYIWVRKQLIGTKDITAFIPAACEFFGHLTFGDEYIYNDLREDDIAKVLHDTTDEYFYSTKHGLKKFLEKNNIH